jgi:hypothetical protein
MKGQAETNEPSNLRRFAAVSVRRSPKAVAVVSFECPGFPGEK